MEFEEMKMIWDAQNEQPLYVLDQDAVHASIRRRGRCIEKGLDVFEFSVIGILLVVAVVLTGKRLFDPSELQQHQLLAGVLILLVAVSAAVRLSFARRRRRQREREFAPSLLGDVDKALSQIDCQISRLKAFHWWFILPLAVMTGLNFVLKGVSFGQLFGSQRAWIWPLFLLALVVCYAAIQFELRCFHLPRKRGLQALRDKLVNGN